MDGQIHGDELPMGGAHQYRITGTHRLLPSAIRRSENNPDFTILPSDFREENVVIDCLAVSNRRADRHGFFSSHSFWKRGSFATTFLALLMSFASFEASPS